MQFLTWCEGRSVTSLRDVRPRHVAGYIETMPAQPQTVKQALAAIRMPFDWLVIGQIVPTNPAGSVRGPKYSIRNGKTPVLSREDTRTLLDSIDASTIIGLRDKTAGYQTLRFQSKNKPTVAERFAELLSVLQGRVKRMALSS